MVHARDRGCGGPSRGRRPGKHLRHGHAGRRKRPTHGGVRGEGPGSRPARRAGPKGPGAEGHRVPAARNMGARRRYGAVHQSRQLLPQRLLAHARQRVRSGPVQGRGRQVAGADPGGRDRRVLQHPPEHESQAAGGGGRPLLAFGVAPRRLRHRGLVGRARARAPRGPRARRRDDSVGLLAQGAGRGGTPPQQEWRAVRPVPVTAAVRLLPKLSGAMLLVAVSVTVSLSSIATRKQVDSLTAQYRSKGEAIALALAFSLSSNTRQTLVKSVGTVRDLINDSKSISGVRYIYIQDWEALILALAFEQYQTESTENNWIAGGALDPGQRVKVADSVQFQTPHGTVWAMDVAVPIAGGSLGVVHVGMNRAAISRDVGALRRELLGAGLGIG